VSVFLHEANAVDLCI